MYDVDAPFLDSAPELERCQIVHVSFPLPRQDEQVEPFTYQFLSDGPTDAFRAADADVEMISVETVGKVANDHLGTAEPKPIDGQHDLEAPSGRIT